MSSFTIQQTSFDDNKQAIMFVREQVFIKEQHVPVELEWDEYDADAIHLVVMDKNHKPIATSRLLDNGHIGRMAVLKGWRKQGIGKKMLSMLSDIAREKGLSRVFLSAQVDAIDFYQKQGFNIISDTYMDAGIPHKDMILNLAG